MASAGLAFADRAFEETVVVGSEERSQKDSAEVLAHCDRSSLETHWVFEPGLKRPVELSMPAHYFDLSPLQLSFSVLSVRSSS